MNNIVNHILNIIMSMFPYGSKRELKRLIKENINNQNVNIPDHTGTTLLCAAVFRGFYKIVKLLLKIGADPNGGEEMKKDKSAWTCLNYACRTNDVDIIKLLVKYGADVNEPISSLIYLSRSRDNIEHITASMECLLIKGACANVTDYYGRSILHDNIISRRYDIVEVLLKYGADINLYNTFDPLIYAIQSNHISLVEKLLKYGFIVTENHIEKINNSTSEEIKEMLKLYFEGQDIKFAGRKI